ncbi:protein of unknown function [Blastococcus saxobsidens DD2]|uniref:Uncharacterized protein n=1 Tax=Blastococcus saxobsidens (strain DD2) TaxID=1146883 RepID=H6RKF3_BLASD|nr:protein of unknown function [Blastococcus saxobsidens DD2]
MPPPGAPSVQRLFSLSEVTGGPSSPPVTASPLKPLWHPAADRRHSRRGENACEPLCPTPGPIEALIRREDDIHSGTANRANSIAVAGHP